MPYKYKSDALLTLEELSDRFGYTHNYMRRLASPGNPLHDPLLVRLRIKTDESYRKAYGSQAQYVYRYADALNWYENRQR